MSVLLIGAPAELGTRVVERLVSQSDEVRVIEDDPLGDRYRSLGAHVARGHGSDSDLVERAAQSVRTAVVFLDGGSTDAEVLGAALEGARRAAVPRLVVCSPPSGEVAGAALAASGLDYVLLVARRPRRALRGAGAAADDLAEAVDAADDLAGHPRLVLDLASPDAWRALGVDRAAR